MELAVPNSAVDANPRRFKRARISLACTSCREHKTRCDGRKPMCSHCQRRNPKSQVPCLYRNQAQIRETQEKQSLLERISQLEGELATEKSSTSDVGINRSRKHALPLLDPGQARLRGPGGANGVSMTVSPPALADGIARGQDSEIEARTLAEPIDPDQNYGIQNSNRYSSEITSRPSVALGPGDLSGCNVSPSQKPAGDLSVESPLPPGSENQQQTQRLDTTNGHVPSTHGHAPPEIDEPYFYGEESTTTLMEEVNEMISPSANGTSGQSRDNLSVSSPPIYRKREATVMAFCGDDHDNRSNIKDFDLPPRYLADHLINSYFDRVHILYPFLHRPTFMSAYEKLWAAAASDDVYERSVGLIDTGLGSFGYSSSDSRVFYCGINAMFALSCQFSDMSLQTVSQAAKGYLERSMALLMNTDLLDNGCVSLVQVLLLLSLHLQSTPLRNRLWTIIGLAVRMAQGLGLQDEIDTGREVGEIHNNIPTEIRRRVWYTCTMLDMTVGMTLNRNPIISEGCTVPLPRPLNDESLVNSVTPSPNSILPPQPGISLVSFFIEAIKVSELAAKMLKSIYPRSTITDQPSDEGYKGKNIIPIRDFSIFMHLETTWNALYDNLPLQLRFSDDETRIDSGTKPRTQPEPSFGYSERQRNVLQARLLQIKVLIYRPAFLQFCYEANPRNKTPPSRLRPTDLPSGSKAAAATINSSVLNHCAVACFQTAKDMIHLAHATHGTKAASAWWYNIYYTYTSGVIVILSRHCLPLTKIIGTAVIEETWLLCQKILKNMAMYGAHAKRCLLSLEGLYSRLASWESDEDSSRPVANHNSTISNEQQNNFSIHPNAELDSTPAEESSGRRGNSNQAQARAGEKILGGVYRDPNEQEKNNMSMETDLGPDMAGTLPWNIDLNDWLSWNMDGTDFQDMSWQGMGMADF